MSPVSVLPFTNDLVDIDKKRGQALSHKDSDHQPAEFPPMPIDSKLQHKIVSEFCKSLTPDALEEAGCAVCGQLVPVSELTRLKAVKNLLHILHASGVTT